MIDHKDSFPEEEPTMEYAVLGYDERDVGRSEIKVVRKPSGEFEITITREEDQ